MSERQNIPFIHNYCDRWCERCYFTSRCAVYEDAGDLSPDELDMRNKAFWERLSKNFAQAKHLLLEAAERGGIDLNALQEEMEEEQERKEQIKKRSKEHPLGKLSWEYSEIARKWLDTQPGMIDKLQGLKDQLELGDETHAEVKLQTETIKDCLAVIQWYCTFIHVKFVRALMGRMKSVEDDEDEDYHRDADGSAKIAVIAIDRSMQAWSTLFEMMPNQEDDFLGILSLLEKIKVLALKEFPKAMDFIRPGFDEAV